MGETQRILVVDDEPPMRQIVSFWCERAGLKTTLARHATEGLEFAQATAYCLIITANRMPGMNGFELCTELRRTELHRDTPIIMISAGAQKVDHRSVKQLGLFLVPKPFAMRELQRLIVNIANPT